MIKAYVKLIESRSHASFLWKIEHCPLCGKKHYHCAGEDLRTVRRTLGRRVPHCGNGEKNTHYVLIWDGSMGENVKIKIKSRKRKNAQKPQ